MRCFACESPMTVYVDETGYCDDCAATYYPDLTPQPLDFDPAELDAISAAATISLLNEVDREYKNFVGPKMPFLVFHKRFDSQRQGN